MFLLLGARGAGSAPAPKPNILVLLPDQWRAQAFGFAGDPNVRTPNLDRLAAESVSFVNAVAGVPVCCPTRASLLTGRRALSTGVFLNDVPLATNALTLAKVLRQAGYDTGYIGKWHLNGDGRSAFIPPERRQGFDYWKALECTHDYRHSAYYADGPEKLQWEGYDAFAQTADAERYLREHARTSRPFLLFLAWGPPHDPYQTAPDQYRERFVAAQMEPRGNVPAAVRDDAKKWLAGYYAHCAALDDCVGHLRAALVETRLETNTLLIFTSDHGDLLGSHGGRNKQQPYDESVRVPLLLHWPSGFGREPRRLMAPFNSEDFMPTVLGLCGIPIPKTVEGIDFSRYLKGWKDPSDGAALLACIAPFGQWTRKHGGREYRGIRTEQYTYVADLNGPWLLFDNLRDPLQMTNLVGNAASAALQKKMHAALQRKLKRCGDAFRPGSDYIAQWRYVVDREGTVPYDP